MEETLQTAFRAYTRHFTQLVLRYSREQTTANWHAVEEAQALLYQVQVYQLEGNFDHAYSLLPTTSWPAL